MLLSIQNITKTYKNGVKALDSISIDMQSGMFGLLGPNGAGKSSLMRTIATLQQPDMGSIFFEGEDIFEYRHEYRRGLGYLPQDFGVYPKETAAQLLDYFSVLKGIVSKKDREISVDRVLEITNLVEVRHKRVSNFSGGMRQRFGIAQLLLNNPKVIIVDEPTAGLDPAERTRFLNVLRRIGTENIVIFSTHLVEDVKDLCQDMAIMNKGKLLSQISPRLATTQLQGKIWESNRDASDLKNMPGETKILSSSYDESGELICRVYADMALNETYTAVSPKLEDYYFYTLNK